MSRGILGHGLPSSDEFEQKFSKEIRNIQVRWKNSWEEKHSNRKGFPRLEKIENKTWSKNLDWQYDLGQ